MGQSRHPTCACAALQQAQAGPALVLIRIEPRAGHYIGNPTSQQIEENSDKLDFLSQVLDAGGCRRFGCRGQRGGAEDSVENHQGKWDQPGQKQQEEERAAAAHAAAEPKMAPGPPVTAPTASAETTTKTTSIKESVVHIFILRYIFLRSRAQKVLVLRLKKS
jgi:hypothetical protein